MTDRKGKAAEELLQGIALCCAAACVTVLWYCGIHNPMLYLMAGYLAVSEYIGKSA